MFRFSGAYNTKFSSFHSHFRFSYTHTKEQTIPILRVIFDVAFRSMKCYNVFQSYLFLLDFPLYLVRVMHTIN